MPATRPNLLILTTDQQSHDVLSCAGNPWLRTPQMDRIAAWGTRFPRAYCANPVCLPSRFSWWSGRMPSAIGVRHNGSPVDAIPDAVRRGGLGNLLQSAGYSCHFGGKTHLPRGLDIGQLGFDHYQDDMRDRLAVDTAAIIHRLAADAAPWCIAANFINPHDICYQAIRAFAAGTPDEELVRRGGPAIVELDDALRLPADVDEQRFFADYCPPLPANAAVPADEAAAISRLLDERSFRKRARREWGEREWRLHRWAYYRLTERVDAQIGVVLDALEASGQRDDTVIIFASDHGDHSGSHALEHKTTFYEESVRVPLIIAHPGHGPAGQVAEQHLANSSLDLLATCCDYAGLEAPPWHRGNSLRSVVAGHGGNPPAGIYAENQIGWMWVTATHKYCRYDAVGVEESLHDLQRDPGEMRNLVDDPASAAVLAQQRAALDAALADHQALVVC